MNAIVGMGAGWDIKNSWGLMNHSWPRGDSGVPCGPVNNSWGRVNNSWGHVNNSWGPRCGRTEIQHVSLPKEGICRPMNQPQQAGFEASGAENAAKGGHIDFRV